MFKICENTKAKTDIVGDATPFLVSRVLKFLEQVLEVMNRLRHHVFRIIDQVLESIFSFLIGNFDISGYLNF